MARPLWKGAVNFGLVHIPVKMYRATTARSVRFRELHDADGAPLKQKRVCSLDGKEVPHEHVVKGYEISPDHFVVIQPSEIEALESREAHTLDIESFVRLEQVDPIYFEDSYYLAPDKAAAKAYALLLDAMREADKAALAKFVLRSKQHLALLRPSGDALTVSTLFYADEVLSQEKLDELPKGVKVDRRELDMATQLIDSLTEDFTPDKYHDEYREKLLAMIEQKAEGKQIKHVKPRQTTANVVDLVSALQASIAATKKDRPAEKKSPAKSSKSKRRMTA